MKDDDSMNELERLGLADMGTDRTEKISVWYNPKIIEFQSRSA